MAAVRITPQVVQAVRDAIDIVDIAQDLTRLERKGKRYKGLCPFHKEKTPSFSVDADSGLYYCFGCGAGGDAIKLFMEQSGDDFPAAIEALARRYGVPLPEDSHAAGRAEERRELRPVLEAAADFFRDALAKNAAARGYLRKRQISESLITRYSLGYAPDGWSRLYDALRNRFPLTDLVAAGLVGRSSKSGDPYDRFRHRLIFPIHSPSGRLVGFGGRTLGDDRAKYINTSETDEFHKGRLLYGFHQAKRSLRESGRAILVEGYFDVIGAVACGLDTAVAGMGTALTPEQAKLLSRYAERVVVAYDGDEAGEKAFTRSLPLLLAAGLEVRRAHFPAGHDPDSLRLDEGPEAVEEVIGAAPDAVELELERLTPKGEDRSPAKKSQAASAMLKLLRPLRDEMVRRDYASRAADRLGIDLDVLLRRLGPRLYYDPERQERKREIHSLEEQALQLLLQADPEHLPASLPPDEIFFDGDCRNIYTVFCVLYRGGGESPPSTGEVLARIRSQSGPATSGVSTIDRMARLLLEENTSALAEDLESVFARLTQRWRKQRQGELMSRIRQAQERGDEELLARLLEEKKSLSRSLHPDMTGRWW